MSITREKFLLFYQMARASFVIFNIKKRRFGIAFFDLLYRGQELFFRRTKSDKSALGENGISG